MFTSTYSHRRIALLAVVAAVTACAAPNAALATGLSAGFYFVDIRETTGSATGFYGSHPGHP